MAGQLNKSQIDEIRQRAARLEEIELGALPTTDELCAGYPFCKRSAATDRRLWLSALALNLPIDDGLALFRDAIELAIAVGDAASLRALRDLFVDYGEYLDSAGGATSERIRFYIAVDERGDEELEDLIGALMPAGLQHARTIEQLYRYAFAVGLRVSYSSEPDEIVDQGLKLLQQLGQMVAAAVVLVDGKQAGPSDVVRPLDVDLDSIDDIVAQQRAFANPQQSTAVVVIPAAPGSTAKTGASRDLWKSVEALAGKRIEVDDSANLVPARGELTRRYPHLLSEIDISLRAPHPLRLLLVGEPGAGKTAFARSLADALGLQSMLYSAAGVADGAFGGTSAQWNSARMSVPLQLIARTRVANPVVIVDELDKVDPDRRNGSLADSLLTFLEPSSSRKVMDLGLEVEVDLSRVGYIATANDLDAVPAMLRDRFKIVRVPLPTIEHLPALTEHMIADIAVERDLDRAWLQPLAGDELEIIGNAWSSRSMRQLRRLVEIIINGRETLATWS